MFETMTSLTGLPAAVLAVWVVLIGALYLVSRGLSRTLAWAFVAGGLAVPVAVLQFWPPASPDACQTTVLAEGDSADARYAYRILKNQCRGSSELAYRVDLGRKDPMTEAAALRPVMRSYGFPRPVAVRQIADNHFLIFLTSDGRDQVPLRISLDPESGEPSYVHRFFQGQSDRSFTVSSLPEKVKAQEGEGPANDRKCSEDHRPGMDATVTARPAPRQGAPGHERTLNFRLRLQGLLPSG